MAVKYRYIGNGAYLPGIPARDLSSQDVRALDPALRRLLEEHLAGPGPHLYEARGRGGEEVSDADG